MLKNKSTCLGFDTGIHRRDGVTVIELVLVMVCVFLLVGLAIPMLLANRENARRNQCTNKLTQLYVAQNSYLDAHRAFTAGAINFETPVSANFDSESRSWLISLLPYLNTPILVEEFENQASLNSDLIQAIRKFRVRVLLCPSDSGAVNSDVEEYPLSNYAGAHDHREVPIADDNSGVLILNQQITPDIVTDGLSYTFLLGEIRRSPMTLGWASGTRAMLRNTGNTINQTVEPDESGSIGGFGSYHRQGAQFAMADGSIKMVAPNIDLQIYRAMANRQDEAVPVEGSF